MKAFVEKRNGVMGININGEFFSYAATRSFRPEGRILKSFSEHGIQFFNIFPSGIMTALADRTIPYSLFGPVWEGIGQYNWDNLRKQCDEFFGNISEKCYVSLTVHLDPPPWFVDSHPGMVDHWEQMVQNLGHEEWKKEAANYLCALVDKMDEWYPDRVYAIFLLSGGTTEWYSYHINTVIQKPTELQHKTFSKYVNDPTRRIPSFETLTSATDGVFRHPEKDSEAIDYWKYNNDVVADTILYFADVAKRHTNRTKVVGLFTCQAYGCQLDVAVRMGYNMLDRMVESDDIDMLFCPASYCMRKLESTSGIRTPVDTVGLANKLFVHEIDSSTHLLKKKDNAVDDGAFIHAVGRDEPFKCGSDTKMYMRREVSLTLAKGQGYWWFDMFSGYYDDPDLMKEISDLHELQKEVSALDNYPISEVVEMLDKESNFMIRSGSYYPMAEKQTAILHSAGVPWDMSISSDLFSKDFDTDRYKLFIFPALLYSSEKMQKKLDELRKMGKSLLFMHAPGYVSEAGFSEETMKELSGITLRRCELADNTVVGEKGLEHVRYDFNNGTIKGECWPKKTDITQISPVFYAEDLDVVLARFVENGKPACGYKKRADGGIDAFCACSPMPVELVDEIYKAVGIFRYTDSLEPIYANGAFEGAYSFEGGERTLYRKEESLLTDYFTKETFTVGPKGTKIHFEPHECKMFIVKKL